jgi:hypothetical protein
MMPPHNSPATAPKRRRIEICFTGGQLLLASLAVFVLNALMFAGILFHPSGAFTAAVFSSGWLFAPVVGYVAFRELTETRWNWRLLFAGVISILALAVWLAGAWLVITLKTLDKH